MRTLLGSFLLFALAACADDPAESGPPAVATPVAAAVPTDSLPFFLVGNLAPPATAPVSPAALDDPAARQAHLEALRARSARERETLAALLAAPDWRRADAIARGTAEADSLVDHGTAVAMLQHHLLRGPSDGDQDEAVGRYAQALLAHRSSEGALLLRALRRLDGTWTDGRRRAAARASATRLGTAYASLAGCVDCTIDEALAGMWPEKRRSSEGLLHDIAKVHRELMRIALDGTPMP